MPKLTPDPRLFPDTETTGLDPKAGAELLQIAIVDEGGQGRGYFNV